MLKAMSYSFILFLSQSRNKMKKTIKIYFVLYIHEYIFSTNRDKRKHRKEKTTYYTLTYDTLKQKDKCWCVYLF